MFKTLKFDRSEQSCLAAAGPDGLEEKSQNRTFSKRFAKRFRSKVGCVRNKSFDLNFVLIIGRSHHSHLLTHIHSASMKARPPYRCSMRSKAEHIAVL